MRFSYTNAFNSKLTMHWQAIRCEEGLIREYRAQDRKPQLGHGQMFLPEGKTASEANLDAHIAASLQKTTVLRHLQPLLEANTAALGAWLKADSANGGYVRV